MRTRHDPFTELSPEDAAYYGPDTAADTAAREFLRRAQGLGYIREPSMPDGYEAYLMADAIDAMKYLDALWPDGYADHLAEIAAAANISDPHPSGIEDESERDALAENDPDRCEACGSYQLCDCAVYLV